MARQSAAGQQLMAVQQESGPLRIDIFADVACPWCYLGDARLEKALTRAGVEAATYWHPFQLQPDLPPEGVAWRPFAERKFGSWSRSLEMFEQLSALGQAENLNFRFADIAKANHTADAHRLILHAEAQGRGKATARALYRVYFEEGGDLNDRDVLISVAAELGLGTGVEAYLESSEGLQEVAESQRHAAALGVSGVPFYIFNEQLALAGAQSVETFLEALSASLEPTGGVA